ncbi:hypothetical protein SDC9_190263 [bioreactor metagenome]|uniref:Uncharacterized protein n=1 Tax=bioreactor metagenome TaxID=1076179 RepID=A0A645HVV6_9ZZZZ
MHLRQHAEVLDPAGGGYVHARPGTAVQIIPDADMIVINIADGQVTLNFAFYIVFKHYQIKLRLLPEAQHEAVAHVIMLIFLILDALLVQKAL